MNPETTVLFEIINKDKPGQEMRLVRTYASERRAKEDLTLLKDLDKTRFFDIATVEYIDN